MPVVSGVRQLVVCEALAQLELADLAGCGVRQLVHEDDLVGQPPFGHLAGQKRAQLIARDLGVFPD